MLKLTKDDFLDLAMSGKCHSFDLFMASLVKTIELNNLEHWSVQVPYLKNGR